jgi:hypothetical protein
VRSHSFRYPGQSLRIRRHLWQPGSDRSHYKNDQRNSCQKKTLSLPWASSSCNWHILRSCEPSCRAFLEVTGHTEVVGKTLLMWEILRERVVEYWTEKIIQHREWYLQVKDAVLMTEVSGGEILNQGGKVRPACHQCWRACWHKYVFLAMFSDSQNQSAHFTSQFLYKYRLKPCIIQVYTVKRDGLNLKGF